MNWTRSVLSAAAITLGIHAAALAQTADTIVVFDGSGSMWGQIDGRAKIEIARETLSSVLTEIPSATRIGMIAYGHRQKGVCSDIETVVSVAPASQSVPRMIDVANRLLPKGKTPLSDAVKIAADELRYTENAATVILVTDGIETCNADPCALATELENAGIGFTAHVIGFDLSQEEGRQVQCLADNTGGLYLAAKNADELGDALRRTVQADPILPSEDDFGPAVVAKREVRFVLRDVPDGEQIGIRQLAGILERADGTPVEPGAFRFEYPEAHGSSATATLEPGSYVALLEREGGNKGGYKAQLSFEVPQGDGQHLIEAALSGALVINSFINPNLKVVAGDPFPTAIGGSRPRVIFDVYPVTDGKKSETPAARAYSDAAPLPLPVGTYLVQGNLDNTTAAEHLVDVTSGAKTELDFSFDATRVYVDAREDDGFPVKRETSYWYDNIPKSGGHWTKGRSASKDGLQPFYLPTGTWVLNTGGEGYGKRRSKLVVKVPGDFQDIRLEVGEGQTLSEADEALFDNPNHQGCLELLKVQYEGCLVKRAQLPGSRNALPAPHADEEPASDLEDRVVGVVNLAAAGLSLQHTIGDIAHSVTCQRSPFVFYPDGFLAIKKFENPKGPNDNPFKTRASGQCHMAGNQFECPLTDSITGKIETLTFTSRRLGENHFELMMQGETAPTIAAACFYPGGSINATEIMPNGLPLAQLIMERTDGKALGMEYGTNNTIVVKD